MRPDPSTPRCSSHVRPLPVTTTSAELPDSLQETSSNPMGRRSWTDDPGEDGVQGVQRDGGEEPGGEVLGRLGGGNGQAAVPGSLRQATKPSGRTSGAPPVPSPRAAAILRLGQLASEPVGVEVR